MSYGGLGSKTVTMTRIATNKICANSVLALNPPLPRLKCPCPLNHLTDLHPLKRVLPDQHPPRHTPSRSTTPMLKLSTFGTLSKLIEFLLYFSFKPQLKSLVLISNGSLHSKKPPEKTPLLSSNLQTMTASCFFKLLP